MPNEAVGEAKRVIKTTIKIAEDLWKEVKIYAVKKGLKLTQVIEAALRKYLEETEKEVRESR